MTKEQYRYHYPAQGGTQYKIHWTMMMTTWQSDFGGSDPSKVHNNLYSVKTYDGGPSATGDFKKSIRQADKNINHKRLTRLNASSEVVIAKSSPLEQFWKFVGTTSELKEYGSIHLIPHQLDKTEKFSSPPAWQDQFKSIELIWNRMEWTTKLNVI